MTAAHFAMQPKGGVGKSWVATMIAQYLKEKGIPYRAVDLEASNAACTLSGFKGVEAERLEVMEDSAVNPRRFDVLIEQRIAVFPETFVVDIGTSLVVPFSHYMYENQGFNLVTEAGKELFLHIPLMGGGEAYDCLMGYVSILEKYPIANIVVWLGRRDGEVTFDSQPFELTKAYADTKKRVRAIIRTPRLDQQRAPTFRVDLTQMIQRLETFAEALAPDRDPPLPLMERQRLTLIRRELWAQMDAAKVFG